MVKNIRVEIVSRIKELPIQPKKADKKKTVTLYDKLRDVQHEEWRALNKCITLLYADTQENMILKDKYGSAPNATEKYGKSLKGYLYDVCKEDMITSSSYITAFASHKAADQFKKDKAKGLLKGESSLSNFRRDVGIFIPEPAVKISKETNGYVAEISLFNQAKNVEFGFNRTGGQAFDIINPDGSKKATLDKIIDGEYKLGSVTISHDAKGKWYLHISFHFKSEHSPGINIMGVDLGINNAAAISVYNPIWKTHQRISYKEALIQGGVVEEVRTEFQKRRRDLGKATKLSNTKNGYRRKNKKLLSLGQKESNFRDMYNHKISKYVVDTAVKRNCGLIQLEDLSGGFDDKFLRNWAYYDLQEKIIYKAAEKGIEVVKVDPKYTTKRCSYCGVINFDINDTSIHEWKCTCGKKHNRDINAAMNLAIPDIEKIIDIQLEAQRAS